MYARREASADRWAIERSVLRIGSNWKPGGAPPERSAKVGFKVGIRGIKQFPTRYDDDVDGGG